MNNHTRDVEQPTEATPLLSGRIGHALDASDVPSLPEVEPVVIQLRQKGIGSFSLTDLVCPQPLTTDAARAAFSLNVLLETRARLGRKASGTREIWEQWASERQSSSWKEELDRHILLVWSEFLHEQRTSEEIAEVLWLAFPLKAGHGPMLRVTQFLASGQVPEDLLSHRVVLLCVIKTWKYGLPGKSNPMILSRFDSVATPRVLHTVDLLLYAMYLGLLVHFVLLPSAPSTGSLKASKLDIRVLCLMLYSGSRLLKTWSLRSVPFFLVLLAFLNHIPSVPSPDDLAYHVLLYAFSWHVIELHLPLTPTPLVYLPFHQTLPLAVLIWHGISRIFLPVIAFFLPAMLVSLAILSLSMRDILDIGFITTYAPAPMQARTAFVALFCVTLLLLLSSLVILVLTYPSFSLHPSMDPWDRYSKSVGLQARIALVRVVSIYVGPYIFPCPMNILQFALRIPHMVAMLMGKAALAHKVSAAERTVWRLAVGPLMLIVAAPWLWNRTT
ncbi:hypothetical protein OBBRIDRAFT_743150 [Obba rivulosa]|uniref:Uncharacterized protein n=1 Tax=Obba rivulosa TaxID=1052685 RepID=A0A8E2DV70_9APHY|nr:hypothetical protein OBBRIDRAFT_743150 [Obba rivulosa]